MSNIFTKLPYYITGDNYEKLKNYDANSRKKINILGWFAFIPSVLWFLSGFLLCYRLLATNFVVAWIVGIVAAFMIFVFERNIVQSVKTHWILTSLRVILGLFIAVFSSVIIDLVVFKNDIDHFAQVQLINKEEQKVIDASNNVQSATDRLNKEMEGSSSSKLRGFGRIAKEKKDQVNEEKFKLTQAKEHLSKIKAGLSDTSNPAFKQIKSELGLNTLLNRIKLLHEFVKVNSLAFWSWFILLMIGVLLEIFGVLTKCFYPKSVYEEDLVAIGILMANKRKIALEQSKYYTSLGVNGREALNSISNKKHSILN